MSRISHSRTALFWIWVWEKLINFYCFRFGQYNVVFIILSICILIFLIVRNYGNFVFSHNNMFPKPSKLQVAKNRWSECLPRHPWMLHSHPKQSKFIKLRRHRGLNYWQQNQWIILCCIMCWYRKCFVRIWFDREISTMGGNGYVIHLRFKHWIIASSIHWELTIVQHLMSNFKI